jgi:hypothetical protein
VLPGVVEDDIHGEEEEEEEEEQAHVKNIAKEGDRPGEDEAVEEAPSAAQRRCAICSEPLRTRLVCGCGCQTHTRCLAERFLAVMPPQASDMLFPRGQERWRSWVQGQWTEARGKPSTFLPSCFLFLIAGWFEVPCRGRGALEGLLMESAHRPPSCARKRMVSGGCAPALAGQRVGGRAAHGRRMPRLPQARGLDGHAVARGVRWLGRGSEEWQVRCVVCLGRSTSSSSHAGFRREPCESAHAAIHCRVVSRPDLCWSLSRSRGSLLGTAVWDLRHRLRV